MSEESTSILLDAGPTHAESPTPLYAFPARAWHRNEYAALRDSAVGPALAVISEPQGELAWAATSIESMAVRYAALIHQREAATATPQRRPIALLGWSVGALVALETAQRLAGDVQVAWVGMVDASTFPLLRQQLAETPALPSHERRELEAVMNRWLEGSNMRAHWLATLQHMGAAQHDLFLREVVASYGAASPFDGPLPESQEHDLWSRLNCLRLGLGYTPPGEPPALLRWWRSAEMADEVDTLREHFAGHALCGAVEVIGGSGHLDVLGAQGLHEGVVRALVTSWLD